MLEQGSLSDTQWSTVIISWLVASVTRSGSSGFLFIWTWEGCEGRLGLRTFLQAPTEYGAVAMLAMLTFRT